MEKSVHNLSSNEKWFAGFAYLLGLIPAILIWFWKKEDSPYIKFHAMQAALYAGIVCLFTGFLLSVQTALIFITSTGTFLGTNLVADTLKPESPLIYVIITIFMLLIISVGFSVIALVVFSLHLVNLMAAVYVFAGLNWRYPLLGGWAERIMQKDEAFSKGLRE